MSRRSSALAAGERLGHVEIVGSNPLVSVDYIKLAEDAYGGARILRPDAPELGAAALADELVERGRPSLQRRDVYRRTRLRPRGNRHGAGEEAREAESEALGTAAAKEITSTDRYGATGIGASLTQTLKKPVPPAGLGAVSVVAPVAGADAPGHARASSDSAESAA